jgi:hypothetical protein
VRGAVAAVEVTGAWLSAARGAEADHLMRVTDEVSQSDGLATRM